MSYSLLFYYFFIVTFFIFIYSLQFQNNNNKNQIHYKSIIKDKEFILFKISLFNFYYTTLIILSYLIFKNNGLYYLLNLNIYFIFILFTILIIYSILFSNIFNLKIFNLYLIIKNNIKLFNEINLVSITKSKFLYKGARAKNSFSRNFSTYNHNQNSDIAFPSAASEIGELELDSYDTLDTKPMSKLSLEKAKELKHFHKNYGGGFFGYKHIVNFGNCGENLDSEILFKKVSDYLNNIPNNLTYTILFSLRFEKSNGEFSGITLADSIRVTKETSPTLISIKIMQLLYSKTLLYNLDIYDCDLFIMGRP
jgi:hypothetical protein